jgi:hypothetical protein
MINLDSKTISWLHFSWFFVFYTRASELRRIKEMKTYCHEISKASCETLYRYHVPRKQSRLNTRLHHSWDNVSVIEIQNDQRMRCYSGIWGRIEVKEWVCHKYRRESTCQCLDIIDQVHMQRCPLGVQWRQYREDACL